ncbi:ABC-three component system middle component 7 [Arcobacter cloacae]|uniref:Uncharacterized protein n=1 Tax=Arcobacter cloacae TaxID=1054034 RepID=A0A4Q0ZHN0_9BACT|nr:ABC-three component system middle component 7 [Arcobacter cloacae]RXJ85360.1 hypothetical protein CRU90_01930 [Arcobacter cloacae]
MLLPSKFTSFQESIIYKMILILELEERKINVNLLYQKVKNKFTSIDEFIFALDGLYALGYITIDEEDIKYVS